MTNATFFEVTRRAKFNALMIRYIRFHDEGRGDDPEALDLLAEAMPLCPPELKKRRDEIIEEVFGPMPKAEFCDDNGIPCYSVAQLETWLGHKIDQKDLERATNHCKPTGSIHRLQ